MKWLAGILFLLSFQFMGAQEVQIEEENGFLKIREVKDKSNYKYGGELERVLYIRGGLISSIELKVVEAVPTIVIRTLELIGTTPNAEHNFFSIQIENLKEAKKAVDRMLTKIEK